MTTLSEQVNTDIKESMKAKNQEKLDALRMLKAEFIKNKTSLKPVDELSVVVSHAKKLQDSLELYQEGSEAFEKIVKELEVIRNYLPKSLSEEEVRELIKEIQNTEAKDLGSIMKILQPKIKGRFDGKRAVELIKEMSS